MFLTLSKLRPGFDSSGTAVIMTDNKSKTTFQRLASSGLKPATSRLICKLDEIVNTEVSQQVVSSVTSAVNWIKGSLYFAQLQKDPLAHGVNMNTPDALDVHLSHLCLGSLQRLAAIEALELRAENSVQPTPSGHVMVRASAMVRSGAMQSF